MMTVSLYQESQSEQWDLFIESSSNGTLLFYRGFMDYHKDRFPDRSLVITDGDQWVAVLPGTSKDSDWISHAGLSYGGMIYGAGLSQRKVSECLSSAISFLKTKSYANIYIKTTPEIYWKSPNKSLDYALFQSGFDLYRRDASTSISIKNRKKVSKGRKASLSKAKREGVVVFESNRFFDFIELENANLLKKYQTTAVHSAEEITLLHERFPDKIRLFLAEHETNLIAGGLVFISGEVCHLQYFATNEKGDRLGGGDLVINALIEFCKESHISTFDFGISTENEGRTLNEGLLRYKESFGGTTTLADFYKRALHE